MATPHIPKFYPASSEEMAKMLGLTDRPKPSSPVSAALPVADPVSPTPISVTPQSAESNEAAIEADVVAITGKKPEAYTTPKSTEPKKSKAKVVGRTLLALVPFVLIFSVGMLVYYAWFADPSNRPQIFNSFQAEQTETESEKKAKALAELKEDEAGAYGEWIANYYYNVTEPNIVAMDSVAQNKLTNFENYLLKLNPTTNDVRKTGVSDADQVLAGIDPITGRSLTDAQRNIIAQYLDTEAISTRVAGPATSPRQVITPRVAQAQTPAPSPVQSLPATAAPILPGASADNCAENRLKINTNIPGRLEVPVMGVNVPIIWTKDAKNFDQDLKTGVVHYPCTPLPGDVGTSYISGHSSNYAWVKADFNQVFAKMNDLPNGATFKVTVVGADGKDIRLHYVVQRKQVFEANDQAQFVNTAESLVALSTCWPLNTVEKRMVAFGKLDRVEM